MNIAYFKSVMLLVYFMILIVFYLLLLFFLLANIEAEEVIRACRVNRKLLSDKVNRK